MDCFTSKSVIQSYHIYKEVWEASLGETMACTIESGNIFDPFTVSVAKEVEIIDHVPRKIFAVCSLFLQHHGCITCRVTGWQQFSRDLPQDGLEILTFQGEKKHVGKLQKLIEILAAEDSLMVIVSALPAMVDSDNSTSSSNEDVIVTRQMLKHDGASLSGALLGCE